MPKPLANRRPVELLSNQYLCMAAAHLYGRMDIYERYRTRTTVLLEELINLRPVPGPVQETINQLFPKIDSLRLYISATAADKTRPEFYLSIRRENGLWCIVSRRIFKVDKQIRTGVIFVPDRLRQNDPDATMNGGYTIKRVLTKGTDVSTFMADLEQYETQRMLSHCACVAAWHDFLANDTLAVNTGGGRIVFTATPSVLPYGELWSFEALRDRKYYDAKARFQILGKVDIHGLEVKQRPRCILPMIADAESAYPMLLEMPERVSAAITALLEDRVVPIVGYRVGNWVDVYGLSYWPEESKTIIVKYATHKRSADVAYLPIIEANDTGSFDANKVMVECLKATLLESSADMTPIYERFQSARYVLEQMMWDWPRYDDDVEKRPTWGMIEAYCKSMECPMSGVDHAVYETKMDRIRL